MQTVLGSLNVYKFGLRVILTLQEKRHKSTVLLKKLCKVLEYKEKGKLWCRQFFQFLLFFSTRNSRRKIGLKNWHFSWKFFRKYSAIRRFLKGTACWKYVLYKIVFFYANKDFYSFRILTTVLIGITLLCEIYVIIKYNYKIHHVWLSEYCSL